MKLYVSRTDLLLEVLLNCYLN